MSATATPPAPAVDPALLSLSEAVTLVSPEGGSALNADGTVNVHIIRPGIGRGKGRHLYEADMLTRDAHKFAGWRMYVDHQSPEARKAAGGLPRSVRDLGGRVTESYWDPSVPADTDKGWGQGAVVGKVRPVRFIRELIEDDPALVETSISATATGVRPVTRDGQKVWLVEGIEDRGSVDWVTEGGAGGRIAPKLEEAYADEADVQRALLESMADDELDDHLRTQRPHLMEALASTEPPEEGDMKITPEALREALTTDPEVQEFMRGLVEGTVEAGREQALEEAKAEGRAEGQRLARLAKLEIAAHRQIDESTLPAGWKDALKAEFQLDESAEPTPALDVKDEADDEGKVTKPASEVLAEAVTARITEQKERLAEARPTRVSGNGGAGSELTEAIEDDGDAPLPKPEDTGWGRYLQESGVANVGEAFGVKKLEEAGA